MRRITIDMHGEIDVVTFEQADAAGHRVRGQGMVFITEGEVTATGHPDGAEGDSRNARLALAALAAIEAGMLEKTGEEAAVEG